MKFLILVLERVVQQHNKYLSFKIQIVLSLYSIQIVLGLDSLLNPAQERGRNEAIRFRISS